MSSDPTTSFEQLGAFRVSLTHANLADIGRITTAWAFVEHMVDQVIMFLYALDPTQFEELHGRAQLGTKLDTMKKASSRTHTPSVGTDLSKLCDTLKVLNTDRNHVVHGRWGTHFRMKRGHMVVSPLPGASWNKKEPFFADRLSRLVGNIHKASIDMDRIYAKLFNEEPMPDGGRPFIFGKFLTKDQGNSLRKPPTPRPPTR